MLRAATLARMSKHDQPMVERYWRTVDGTLFLEFPLVRRSADSGPRYLDGLIVTDIPEQAWRGARRLRPSLRNFWVRNALGLAYDACLNPEDAPFLSDDGLVMFAGLDLVGHFAQQARKLACGPTIWPRVLLSLRLLPLQGV